MRIRRFSCWTLACRDCGWDDTVTEHGLAVAMEADHARECTHPVRVLERTFLVDPADVDDTSDCPRHEMCENCGETGDVATATLTFGGFGGVGCMSVCSACVGRADLGSVSVYEAADRVMSHCLHLGVDLDEMADALEREGHP